MTDRERIYNLVDKVCDLSIKVIDKITELKQENSKLKQQVAEFEKPKRKFRTMTNDEFCTKWLLKHKFCKHLDEYCCPLVLSKACFKENANKPCKVNGKYILIEDCNSEVKK
jgi:hypothetical protein